MGWFSKAKETKDITKEKLAMQAGMADAMYKSIQDKFAKKGIPMPDWSMAKHLQPKAPKEGGDGKK